MTGVQTCALPISGARPDSSRRRHMDLSRKTDYALRMVAELVEHEGQIVSIQENAGVD